MSEELNHEARDSLMGQITTAMQSLTKKRCQLDIIIDLYEQAQNSSLSEPMDEVAAIMNKISHRLAVFSTDMQSRKARNLAKLAKEIHKSEGRWNG